MVKRGNKVIAKNSSKLSILNIFRAYYFNNGNGRNGKKNNKHPLFKQRLTFAQKLADKISAFGGSWVFIISIIVFLTFWLGLNSWVYVARPFDPYPYILLNLILSCLAAIQAPIILMSQNRQAERDRVDFKYNYQVNRKAEREIQEMQRELEKIKRLMKKSKKI